MRNKVLSASVLSLCLVAIAMVGVAQAEESWTGEVIDHACFVKQGAHGEDHAACAEKCIKDGGQIGLLTADGDVYVLEASADHGDAFEMLKGLAAAQATVTGEVVEEDGMMVITVTKVEPAMTS